MLVESLLLVQSPFPAARAPMGLDKNLLRHIFRACASNQPLNPADIYLYENFKYVYTPLKYYMEQKNKKLFRFHVKTPFFVNLFHVKVKTCKQMLSHANIEQGTVIVLSTKK